MKLCTYWFSIVILGNIPISFNFLYKLLHKLEWGRCLHERTFYWIFTLSFSQDQFIRKVYVFIGWNKTEWHSLWVGYFFAFFPRKLQFSSPCKILSSVQKKIRSRFVYEEKKRQEPRRVSIIICIRYSPVVRETFESRK